MHLLKGAEFITPGASNRIPHQGQLVQLQIGQIQFSKSGMQPLHRLTRSSKDDRSGVSGCPGIGIIWIKE